MSTITGALFDDPSGVKKEVSVSTVAITVKALTFGNRQFSKSAFNQLVLQKLASDDGTLGGEPLGWVNYHPDWTSSRLYRGLPCGFQSNAHLHVVWRTPENLLRQDVLATYGQNGFAETPESVYTAIAEMPQLFVAA